MDFYNIKICQKQLVLPIVVLVFLYQKWELIFWDNQSTDRSAGIVNKYKDSRIKYFYAPQHTDLGTARILASKYCQGEWIAILDSDDEMYEMCEKYKLKFELENQKTKIEELESDKDRRIQQLENKLDLLQEFLKTSSS